VLAKTSLRLSIPAAHQAVGALLTIKKPVSRTGFSMVPSTGGLSTSRLADARRSRPRLAILAFRAMRSNSDMAAAFNP